MQAFFNIIDQLPAEISLLIIIAIGIIFILSCKYLPSLPPPPIKRKNNSK